MAELESENAVLRAGQTPAPTGPKRWTFNVLRPLLWWHVVLFHLVTIATSVARGTPAFWWIVAVSLIAWVLVVLRYERV